MKMHLRKNRMGKECAMQPKTKKAILDSAVMLTILGAAFGISMLLQNALDIAEHITTLFVFAVFIIKAFNFTLNILQIKI